MPVSRTEQAARNNAAWCDTLYRAHRIPGQFHRDIWLNKNLALHLYPSVVTLSDQRSSEGQLRHVQGLVDSGLSGNWSVKDSFCALDLTRLGFQSLFEAQWVWMPATPIHPSHPSSGLSWKAIQTATELGEWETAWAGDPANAAATRSSPLFLPSLLADRSLRFISAYKGNKMVAGIVANRADGVIGLSNFFALPDDAISGWASCVAAAQACFQGLPLVGYERDAQLAIAEAMGFEKFQRLRVWTRR